MASHKIADAITKANEGGFVNNPNDRGGMTLNGIARKAHPNWSGWKIVDEIIKRVGNNPKTIDAEVKKNGILLSMIEQFYKKNFWDINNLDFVKSQEIANEIYDTGVNMGPKVAAMMLQESLNLSNNRGKLYANVKVDGSIGVDGETMRMLNNKANPVMILNIMNFLQAERYLKILRNDESQEQFAGGWFKRVVIDNRW